MKARGIIIVLALFGSLSSGYADPSPDALVLLNEPVSHLEFGMNKLELKIDDRDEPYYSYFWKTYGLSSKGKNPSVTYSFYDDKVLIVFEFFGNDPSGHRQIVRDVMFYMDNNQLGSFLPPDQLEKDFHKYRGGDDPEYWTPIIRELFSPHGVTNGALDTINWDSFVKRFFIQVSIHGNNKDDDFMAERQLIGGRIMYSD